MSAYRLHNRYSLLRQCIQLIHQVVELLVGGFDLAGEELLAGTRAPNAGLFPLVLLLVPRSDVRYDLVEACRQIRVEVALSEVLRELASVFYLVAAVVKWFRTRRGEGIS